MALTRVIDAVGDYLRGVLSPVPKLVGSVEPTEPGELPAVGVSVVNVTRAHPGLGGVPAPPRTGALRVGLTVDLADPTVSFPDERLTLLSEDRRTLQLPHGSIVRDDGTENPALRPQDLTVVLSGKLLTLVATDPKSGQVRPDPVTGSLLFGARLPKLGTVAVSYFVGQWEMESERFQGELRVESFAASATDADFLSRLVDAALASNRWNRVPGLRSLQPIGWGLVGPKEAAHANARRRSAAYRFDYEHEEPVIRTGGGAIRTVQVASSPGPELFDITR